MSARGPHPLPVFLALARRYAAGDSARMAGLLGALSAYQSHPWSRPASPPDVMATAGSARLHAFGGQGRPAVFVPSLVNSADILDLVEGRSMLRWLASEGIRPMLVDWGEAAGGELAFGVGEYFTERLLPLIETLGEPVDLVGYCLGGTIALGAATSVHVRRIATIAAPWNFAGYSDERRAELAGYWASTEPVANALGHLPMSLVQPAFWSLDTEAAVRKFERFAEFDSGSDAARLFVALEDWANGGAPVTLPAARECFTAFFGANATFEGEWRVGGERVWPAQAGKSIVNFVSRTDRIVPAASAPPFGEQRLIAAGHVGMVVGSAAETQLWAPLADWLRG